MAVWIDEEETERGVCMCACVCVCVTRLTRGEGFVGGYAPKILEC